MHDMSRSGSGAQRDCMPESKSASGPVREWKSSIGRLTAAKKEVSCGVSTCQPCASHDVLRFAEILMATPTADNILACILQATPEAYTIISLPWLPLPVVYVSTPPQVFEGTALVKMKLMKQGSPLESHWVDFSNASKLQCIPGSQRAQKRQGRPC